MSTCPICKSTRIDFLLKWDVYSVNLCSECGAVFSEPLPSDQVLIEYYQGFMFRAPAERDIRRETKRKKKELERLFGPEGVEDAGKSFLDYGGGTGIAYNAARELGWDAYYHDLDRQAVAFVRRQFGLWPDRLVQCLDGPKARFDYILSDNVIEHVKDPERLITTLYNALEHDGKLVLKTPHARNSEALFNPAVSIKEYFLRILKFNSFPVAARAFLKRFWHCAPPRHLYSFSTDSLKVLMDRLNIPPENYRISCYSAPFFSNTLTEHLFKAHGKYRGMKLALLRLMIIPVVPLELILQSSTWVLTRSKVISPGGLMLTVIKNPGAVD